MSHQPETREVAIPVAGGVLHGTLTLPSAAAGLVLFAHGSGSSRHSPRNQKVARALNDRRLATLLFDLLTEREEEVDAMTARLRFDVELLARRLAAATDWVAQEAATRALPLAYFGSSTGAAAALIAAARDVERVRAVVSRGGRPDLAGAALPAVAAPTLLIVGGDDEPVIGMNRDAMRRMTAPVELEIVPGATHLFEEPGTLERVAELAGRWLREQLLAARQKPGPAGATAPVSR
jgi:dienelactone hydrolase